MKMKFLLSSLLGLAISISAVAQTSPGVDYFTLGEMKLAKETFEKEVSQNPMEAYYYLGEIAYAGGNVAEAKSNYEKGLAAAPQDESNMNIIGLAKLELKSNQKESKDKLTNFRKKNKKNAQLIIEVAKAYQANGMIEDANKEIEEARKADKKSPWIYIYKGDLLAKENKAGDAAAQYDQARNFDPDFAIAYIKGARVYEYINPRTAMEMMNKVVELRPNFTITYKYLGDLYYNNGLYKDAIEAYNKYFAAGDYTADDMRRYASCEYLTQNYAESLRVIQDGLKRDPNNFVMNRLSMYNNKELGNNDAAFEAAQKFFNIVKDDSVKYIAQDYTTYGDILSELGKKEEAITQYEKAIDIDPSKVDVFKDIATKLSEENMDAEAAGFQKKYIDLLGDKVDATDYFQLGRYYYSAGGKAIKDSVDSVKEQGNQYLQEADKTFALVTDSRPSSFLGYLWRARTNAYLDPATEKGLAKPYYEKTAEILEADPEASKSVLSEVYRYLSYFYYLQWDKTKSADDKAKTKEFAEKLLGVDPENSIGLQLLEQVK